MHPLLSPQYLCSGVKMSDNEFNLPLWNERFKNIRDDVEEIRTSVSDLKKLLVWTIIGVTGWSLVQIYSNFTVKAHADPVPAVANK